MTVKTGFSRLLDGMSDSKEYLTSPKNGESYNIENEAFWWVRFVSCSGGKAIHRTNKKLKKPKIHVFTSQLIL